MEHLIARHVKQPSLRILATPLRPSFAKNLPSRHEGSSAPKGAGVASDAGRFGCLDSRTPALAFRRATAAISVRGTALPDTEGTVLAPLRV